MPYDEWTYIYMIRNRQIQSLRGFFVDEILEKFTMKLMYKCCVKLAI